MRRTILALILIAASGCRTVPHVEIPKAPTTADPYDRRAAYYKAYSADGMSGGALLLHGGERVHWPEDLLPAVDEASPTAKAIRRVVQARERLEARSWFIGVPATIAVAGGSGLMLASPALLFFDGVESDVMMPTLLAGAGIAVGGLAWGWAGEALFNAEDRTTFETGIETVLQTYPQSLSDRVAIQPSADGLLLDLEAVRDAPPPSTSAQTL